MNTYTQLPRPLYWILIHNKVESVILKGNKKKDYYLKAQTLLLIHTSFVFCVVMNTTTHSPTQQNSKLEAS